MGGSIGPERVAALRRNGWQHSPGIRTPRDAMRERQLARAHPLRRLHRVSRPTTSRFDWHRVWRATLWGSNTHPIAAAINMSISELMGPKKGMNPPPSAGFQCSGLVTRPASTWSKRIPVPARLGSRFCRQCGNEYAGFQITISSTYDTAQNAHQESRTIAVHRPSRANTLKTDSQLQRDVMAEPKPMGFPCRGRSHQSLGRHRFVLGRHLGRAAGARGVHAARVGRGGLAGRFVATLVGALEAAVVVGGLPASSAALTQIGVPKDQVIKHEVALKVDKRLLAVHGNADGQGGAPGQAKLTVAGWQSTCSSAAPPCTVGCRAPALEAHGLPDSED